MLTRSGSPCTPVGAGESGIDVWGGGEKSKGREGRIGSWEGGEGGGRGGGREGHGERGSKDTATREKEKNRGGEREERGASREGDERLAFEDSRNREDGGPGPTRGEGDDRDLDRRRASSSARPSA